MPNLSATWCLDVFEYPSLQYMTDQSMNLIDVPDYLSVIKDVVEAYGNFTPTFQALMKSLMLLLLLTSVLKIVRAVQHAWSMSEKIHSQRRPKSPSNEYLSATCLDFTSSLLKSW